MHKSTGAMTVLHLASHTGNLGDNFSHLSFRKLLAEYADVIFHDLEIRRFYYNERDLTFERDFVNRLLRSDALLVGGGAFLLPEFAQSSTGTTLDLPNSVLAKGFSKLAILNSVGCTSIRPIDATARQRFSDFLRFLAEDSNVHVFLRNDGSIHAVRELVPPEIADHFVVTPDPAIAAHSLFSFDRPQGLPGEYLAVNLAGDSVERRFESVDHRIRFVEAIRRLVVESPIPVVFVPHIAQDVGLIGDVLRGLTRWSTRTKVILAPFQHGMDGAFSTLGVYQSAAAVLGNRFHGVVTNLGLPVPLGAIINAHNLRESIEELGLTHLEVDVDETDSVLAHLLSSSPDEKRVRVVDEAIQQLWGNASSVASLLAASSHSREG